MCERGCLALGTTFGCAVGRCETFDLDALCAQRDALRIAHFNLTLGDVEFFFQKEALLHNEHLFVDGNDRRVPIVSYTDYVLNVAADRHVLNLDILPKEGLVDFGFVRLDAFGETHPPSLPDSFLDLNAFFHKRNDEAPPVIQNRAEIERGSVGPVNIFDSTHRDFDALARPQT